MGKAGKARKRQRLEGSVDAGAAAHSTVAIPSEISEEEVAISASILDAFSADTALYASKGCKILRKLLFPLIQVQFDKHFEEIPNTKVINQSYLGDETKMKTLENTIIYFTNNMEKFQSLQYKQFRRSLHPLVLYTKKSMNGSVVEKSDQSISNQITTEFRCSNYSKVYSLLLQLASGSDESIKLGHLQRWTRECDLLSKPNVCSQYSEAQLKNMSLLLLYAVLRVMSNRTQANGALSHPKLPENDVDMDSMQANLVTHPYFSAVDVDPSTDCVQPLPDTRDYTDDILVILTTIGKERRPPRYHFIQSHRNPLTHSLIVLTHVANMT